MLLSPSWLLGRAVYLKTTGNAAVILDLSDFFQGRFVSSVVCNKVAWKASVHDRSFENMPERLQYQREDPTGGRLPRHRAIPVPRSFEGFPVRAINDAKGHITQINCRRQNIWSTLNYSCLARPTTSSLQDIIHPSLHYHNTPSPAKPCKHYMPANLQRSSPSSDHIHLKNIIKLIQ
jgi:hypothetical protein